MIDIEKYKAKGLDRLVSHALGIDSVLNKTRCRPWPFARKMVYWILMQLDIPLTRARFVNFKWKTRRSELDDLIYEDKELFYRVAEIFDEMVDRIAHLFSVKEIEQFPLQQFTKLDISKLGWADKEVILGTVIWRYILLFERNGIKMTKAEKERYNQIAGLIPVELHNKITNQLKIF